MPNMKRLALFLNELQEKGSVTPDTQETYSYYTHKKKFWKTIMFLLNADWITIKENNGIAVIKLTWYGSIFSAMLNHAYRDEINVREDFTLSP